MTSVFTETSGSGPDLVLIHGWGLHGGVFDPLLPLLARHLRVTTVDLPGHGRSDWHGEDSLDAMVDAVAAAVPAPATWLGWSLGGLLAMRAASRTGTCVHALVTIASTPSFTRRPDWQSAMLPALLQTFAGDLEQDYARTLDRFLALQVRGSRQATQVLKELRASMRAHGTPERAALQAGLSILAGTDLRDALSGIGCAALLLAGERDTLVPVNAVRETVSMLPRAQLEIVPAAGHAPFLADPNAVAGRVLGFLHEAG